MNEPKTDQKTREQGNRETNHPPANESQPSVSQADGTAANAPRGETQAQPDNQGKDTQVKSQTPENRAGKINPSAPNDGTSGMPANTTRDSSGEVGEPTGEGNLDAPKQGEQPGKDDKGIKKDQEEEAA